MKKFTEIVQDSIIEEEVKGKKFSELPDNIKKSLASFFKKNGRVINAVLDNFEKDLKSDKFTMDDAKGMIWSYKHLRTPWNAAIRGK